MKLETLFALLIATLFIGGIIAEYCLFFQTCGG